MSLEILINISEIHKEMAFTCCADQCSINNCKCLWRGKYLKQTGKMDRGPFSPSPLAPLCQGHESGADMRHPELCSKLSHLSLTSGHLQRLFPSFISRILSEWILRYGQTSALATLGNQGTVSCMALVRGRDEQGQWHIKLWQGATNVSFKKHFQCHTLYHFCSQWKCK